jgi:hypothetical protein
MTGPAQSVPAGAEGAGVVAALVSALEGLTASRRSRRKGRARRPIAVGGLAFSSGSESSSDSSEEDTMLGVRRHKSFAQTRAMRAFEAMLKVAPENGMQRWNEVDAAARLRVSRDPGNRFPCGGTLAAYFHGYTDLQRHPLGVWWLHTALQLEPLVRELATLAGRSPEDEEGWSVSSAVRLRRERVRRVRELTQGAYHHLAGSMLFLDQMAWDEGRLEFAQRVSLLRPPVPGPDPTATRMRRTTEDQGQAASPLVPVELVELAGASTQEQQKVLATKMALQAVAKPKPKAAPAGGKP